MPRTATQLLDRSDQLSICSEVVEAGFAGAGATVVLEGDPGTGKSSILAAVSRSARDRGALVLSARGSSLEQSVGLAVVRQLIEPALMRLTPSDRSAVLTGPAAQLESLLTADPTHPIDEQQLQHALFWLIANLAEQTPVVVVVDDLQWCDQTSAHLLGFLARRIDRSRIAILAATHPAASVDIWGAFVDAKPRTVAVNVLPLAPVGELLASIFERPVEAEFTLACFEWTGGNPLFVTELATELLRAGVEPVRDSCRRIVSTAMPTVERMTRVRLARLQPRVVRLAHAASVLGSRADLACAAELSGLTAAQAAEAADELVRARLLAPGLPLRFSHPVVAAATYNGLPELARAKDHRRAADILARLGAPATAIANQLLKSPPAADPWVVDALMEAVETDLARGATVEARELAGRALAEPPEGSQRARVLFALGRATAMTGDPNGLAILREARDAAGDPTKLAEIEYFLGRLLMFAGLVSESKQVLGRIPTGLEQGTDLHLRIEAAYLAAAHGDRSPDPGEQTRIEQARQVLNPNLAGGRLLLAQLAVHETRTTGNRERAIGHARSALAGDTLLRENVDSPDAHVIPTSMLALCDELEEADTHWSAALELASRTGSMSTYAAATTLGSWTAFLRGDLPRASLWAGDALRVAEEAPAFGALTGFARAHLAMSEIAQGRPARARQVLGNPQLDHLWSPSAADSLLAFGHLELAQDRPHAAAPLFEGCGRLLTESGVTNPAWSQWRAALAGALRAVGRVEEADDLIAVELSLVASFGAPRPWGVTLRSFAESTHGAQRLDALEESVRLLRRSAARLELARSLESWGHALCASGHGPDGMARLQESLLLAQATGSRPLVKRCRAELIKGGTRVPAVGAKTSTTLTAAELRVCTMAAEGMSNREIAQALFVSRATVESHLHASYGKLGVERRGQLASILAP